MKVSKRSSRRQLRRIGAAVGGGLLAKHERGLAGENTPGQLGIPLGPYFNGIIGNDQVMDAKSLPKVKMPNRDGFVADPRPDVGKKAKR